MASRYSRGFTLIEMLVALLILALLAIAGYRGLNAVLDARTAVSQETRKWQQLMFFFSRMDQDIAQALPRPVRNTGGVTEPEFIGHQTLIGANDAQLAFTRAGFADAGAAQLAPQRIGYRLDGNTILLLRWPALDQPVRPAPRRYPLLKGVRAFDLRYLTTAGVWLKQWPPPGQNSGMPSAVEVSLTLADGKTITRVFARQ